MADSRYDDDLHGGVRQWRGDRFGDRDVFTLKTTHLNTKTVAVMLPKMRWAFRRVILSITVQYIWTKSSCKTKILILQLRG